MMNILKQSDESPLFVINDIDEDQLIGLYNIAINYKSYVEQLLKMSDKQLLAFAPGKSADQVRGNLKLQVITCFDYQRAWETLIQMSKESEKLEKMN